MIKIYSLFLFSISFFFSSAYAVTTTTEQSDIKKIQQQALKSNLAFKLVSSLTTEVGPRLAGSENDRKAVDWAEKKLLALGFDKVYKEPVPVRDWHRKSASLTVTTPFQHTLAITSLGGSISTPAQGIEGKVVFIDNLIDLQQADSQTIKNNIVFISTKINKDKTGSAYSQHVSARTHGAIAAAKLGAKAVIIRSIGTASSRLPHTGSMRYHPDIKKIPAAAISNADADLLENMQQYKQAITLKLNIQNSETQWLTSHNVIGEITGSEKPDEYILLGAHLDSWDLGTGAIDNGAGVAIVTAAAHIVKQFGQPKRTIKVVLFANEEFGLKGAKSFSKQHKADLDKIIIAAESDFGAGDIWRFDTRIAANSLSFSDQIFANVNHFGISRGHNQALGGPDISILAKQGVPIVNWLQDGSDYFDYHHSADDTLDKIKPESLQQNVAVYATFAFMIANSDISFR